MRMILWLAWRELVSRKTSFLISTAMITAAVALCTATEFVSIAREAAVKAKIDFMGPVLRIVPEGITSADMARFDLGSGLIPENFLNEIRKGVSPWIRSIEGRLVIKDLIGGIRTPVIGINLDEIISPFDILTRFGEKEAVLGMVLAQKLGKRVGDIISFRNDSFRIAGVLGTTGTEEDLALFINVKRLRTMLGLGDVINEARLFPSPGVSPDKIESFLRSNYPQVDIVRSYRGDIAEKEVDESLQKYRWVVYLITSFMVGLSVLIWSYLNACERDVEIATIVAVGGNGLTVFLMLVSRAAIVGLLGSMVGFLLGFMITSTNEFVAAVNIRAIWNLQMIIMCIVVGVSAMAAAPVSVIHVFREHVKAFQE